MKDAADIPELYNATLEKCILGAMILDNNLIPEIEAVIRLEDYFFENNRAIHSLISQMYKSGSRVDFNLINDWRNRHNLAEIDIAYVATCIDELPDYKYARTHLDGYINKLRELSGKRKLRTAFQNALQQTANGIDVRELIATHKQTLALIESEISQQESSFIEFAPEFLNDATDSPIEYLIPQYVACGKLHLLHGVP